MSRQAKPQNRPSDRRRVERVHDVDDAEGGGFAHADEMGEDGQDRPQPITPI